jgi:hypothetical protein
MKLAAPFSCPPVRALLITGTPVAEVTARACARWVVCVCVIATLVEWGLAVLGFYWLLAGGMELDANFGLGANNKWNAVPFLRQASGMERAKKVIWIACLVVVVLCVALAEA